MIYLFQRRVVDKVQVPETINIPNSNGGHEKYVFNGAVEHIGQIDSGHYKLHVQDRWGFCTIEDSRPAVATTETSIQNSTLFFYGKQRFYDRQGEAANDTNQFPSLGLDITEEVDLDIQQSMIMYQEEEARVAARKKRENEMKKKKKNEQKSLATPSTSQSCEASSSVTIPEVAEEIQSLPSEGTSMQVEVNLVAKSTNARRKKAKSQLEKLTKGHEYHLYHPKSEKRFGWLIFGLAGIILTMKEAEVELEQPPQKSPQELSINEFFKMVFHLNPGEIVDFSVIAQKLGELTERQDLTTQSQSIRELLDLDVFSGNNRPWEMLVPTLARRLLISGCKCDNRSENEEYEKEALIQPCPFEVHVPKKMPKGQKLSLQSLIDHELWVESVCFGKCAGCGNQKIQSDSELRIYDGAKGIIFYMNHYPMSKQAKKKNLKIRVPIEEVIRFDNFKNDTNTPLETNYRLVCGIEEAGSDQIFHFKSRKQVVTISNGEEMKLGKMEDFESCKIFFFKNIGQENPDDFDMDFDSD